MEPTPRIEKCHECGSEFQQRRFWQRWCKPDCRRAYYKRKMQEDRQKLKDLETDPPQERPLV